MPSGLSCSRSQVLVNRQAYACDAIPLSRIRVVNDKALILGEILALISISILIDRVSYMRSALFTIPSLSLMLAPPRIILLKAC